jgi:endo-1,4-beta-D-glucanase Y
MKGFRLRSSVPVFVFSALLLACSEAPSDPLGSGGTPVGSGGVVGGGGVGSGGTLASGGAPSTGGTSSGGTASGGAASGGGPSGPTIATEADATAAYETWKAIHLEDCGNGVMRVPWENAKLDATVSEGIGYGMLLAVTHGEQSVVDGLLAYSKLMHDENGLMHWLRYGCDAHGDTLYNANPDYAAADADLDVAMALLMADCKWPGGNYGDEATTVINAIKNHMFMENNGLQVLQPGDSSWFDQMGAGCVNYSYFAPAYYREFGKHVPADQDFWNKAATDTYALLAAGSDPTTGLVRNWGSAGGGDATSDCHNAYNRAGSYGDDAARTPWRIATDYQWNGTTEAKAWNDKVTTWVKTIGITNIVQWYRLDGMPDTEANTWDDHTVVNIGPFAVGAMTFDRATADEFTAEVLAIPSSEGNHDAEYFPRMLKALALLNLTDQFTICGGM